MYLLFGWCVERVNAIYDELERLPVKHLLTWKCWADKVWVAVSYIHVIKVIQTSSSYWDVFYIYVATNNSVICLIVFFFWWALCGFIFSQPLYLTTKLVNVMKWITVSIIWVFWRYTWSLWLPQFFFFFNNINPFMPHHYVQCALISSTQNINKASPTPSSLSTQLKE